MKAKVVTFANKSVGEKSLKKNVFGLPERKDILHRAVVWQLAKRQQGTHKTKVVSEIRGTTAKPYKQKGTGRARQGSLRSAQFRGGATQFGPKVRSHAHLLPKKIRKLALKTALSFKQKSGQLFLLKDDAIDSSKTKDFEKQISSFKTKSILIITGKEVSKHLKNAASNIPSVDVMPQIGANVYDILQHETLLLTEAGLTLLEERLQ